MVGRVKGGAGSSKYCGGLASPPVPANSQTIGPATAAARRALNATLIHVLPRLHHGRLVRIFFFIALYATLYLIVIVCWPWPGSLVCNSTSITSFIARVPSGTLRLKTRFPFSPGATCGSSTEKASTPQPHAVSGDGRTLTISTVRGASPSFRNSTSRCTASPALISPRSKESPSSDRRGPGGWLSPPQAAARASSSPSIKPIASAARGRATSPRRILRATETMSSCPFSARTHARLHPFPHVAAVVHHPLVHLLHAAAVVHHPFVHLLHTLAVHVLAGLVHARRRVRIPGRSCPGITYQCQSAERAANGNENCRCHNDDPGPHLLLLFSTVMKTSEPWRFVSRLLSNRPNTSAALARCLASALPRKCSSRALTNLISSTVTCLLKADSALSTSFSARSCSIASPARNTYSSMTARARTACALPDAGPWSSFGSIS